MKKILLSLFIMFSLTSFSQTKENQLTQAEQFSSQSGTLIEKQYLEIGKVKGIKVEIAKFKDLNSSIEKNALRFEYEYKSSYSTDTKIASLDSDEIDALIKSIKNLQNSVFTTTREIYTEITFKSRTGFEAGAFYGVDKAKWSAYVQIEKFDRNSTVFLSTEELISLLGLIEKAKAKM